jgi:deoxyribodipyrimidine photo-lyase
MIEIVWFKRDLRGADHAPLAEAAASGRPVLPLYIVEPALWSAPEASGRQYAFLLECLADLRESLRARGAGLVVRIGDAVEVFGSLHAHFGIAAIRAHEETGLQWSFDRDRRVKRWAAKAGVDLVEYRQHGVWRAAKTRNGWAERWEAMMRAPTLAVPSAIPFAAIAGDETPDASSLGLADDPCQERQAGGRRAGVDALKSFLDRRGRQYRRLMSTPLQGAEACSRISPHLAYGTLSMREVFQAALKARRTHLDAGDGDFAQSISAFISRLHWHCHFIQKLEDEPSLDRRALHPAYEALRTPGPDRAAHVTAWSDGRTGFPFVDACMRSLRATGWLNFRMRSMVMAFSSYHLWQDWRLPAQALARLFTDFEPGIHYAQAQMQSGVTGVNTARIYNPVKQSYDQDPDGIFIRRWVPELIRLPTPFLHEPWRAPPDALAAAGVCLGENYPCRLVDHVRAARAAREQIYSVRRGNDHRMIAKGIVEKHGSRQSGLSRPSRRRRPGRGGARAAQHEFDFG